MMIPLLGMWGVGEDCVLKDGSWKTKQRREKET